MSLSRVMALTATLLLAGCAVQEDNIPSEKPMMEAAPVIPCESGDEDGIGGTGCEPLE